MHVYIYTYICIYAYICVYICIYVKPSKHEVYKFKLVSRGTFPKHSSKNLLPKGNWFPLDSSFSYQTPNPFFNGAKGEKVLGIDWILGQHLDAG